MLHVGLDVHERLTAVHVLDANGKKSNSFTFKGHWTGVIGRLKELPRPFAVCFEASTGYGYLYDALRPLAKRVAVAHPGKTRLIFRSKRKNDRIDAEKLAKLSFLGEVPEVYVPGQSVRNWRRLITFRGVLVAERVRTKNRLRGLLRRNGVESPRALWTRKGIAWLESLELAGEDALERELLLDDLARQGEKIRRVERHLATIAQGDPRVALLRTIPGVGIRTAEALAAWIDSPHRFTKNKSIGAYFGLVPSEDSSAGKQHLGHMTHQGPALVRKLIIEATWQALRRSPAVRAYHERMLHGDPQRKKIALVATAHYLLRCALAMLQHNEPWRSNAA
jgi:transposase